MKLDDLPIIKATANKFDMTEDSSIEINPKSIESATDVVAEIKKTIHATDVVMNGEHTNGTMLIEGTNRLSNPEENGNKADDTLSLSSITYNSDGEDDNPDFMLRISEDGDDSVPSERDLSSQNDSERTTPSLNGTPKYDMELRLEEEPNSSQIEEAINTHDDEIDDVCGDIKNHDMDDEKQNNLKEDVEPISDEKVTVDEMQNEILDFIKKDSSNVDIEFDEEHCIVAVKDELNLLSLPIKSDENTNGHEISKAAMDVGISENSDQIKIESIKTETKLQSMPDNENYCDSKAGRVNQTVKNENQDAGDGVSNEDVHNVIIENVPEAPKDENKDKDSTEIQNEVEKNLKVNTAVDGAILEGKVSETEVNRANEQSSEDTNEFGDDIEDEFCKDNQDEIAGDIQEEINKFINDDSDDIQENDTEIVQKEKEENSTALPDENSDEILEKNTKVIGDNNTDDVQEDLNHDCNNDDASETNKILQDDNDDNNHKIAKSNEASNDVQEDVSKVTDKENTDDIQKTQIDLEENDNDLLEVREIIENESNDGDSEESSGDSQHEKDVSAQEENSCTPEDDSQESQVENRVGIQDEDSKDSAKVDNKKEDNSQSNNSLLNKDTLKSSEKSCITFSSETANEIETMDMSVDEVDDNIIELEVNGIPKTTDEKAEDNKKIEKADKPHTSSLKRSLEIDDAKDVDVKKSRINGIIPNLKDDKPIKKYLTLESFNEFMIKQEIKTLSKSELEELCLQKICEAINQNSKAGELYRLSKMKEQKLENLRTKYNSLLKQIRDLEIVHTKALTEMRQKVKDGGNTKDVTPVKITRSVGLQVNLQLLPVSRVRQAPPALAAEQPKRKQARMSAPSKMPTASPKPANVATKPTTPRTQPKPIQTPASTLATPNSSPNTATQQKGLKTILPKVLSGSEVREVPNSNSVLGSYLQKPPVNATAAPQAPVASPVKKVSSTAKVIDLTDEDDANRAMAVNNAALPPPTGNIRIMTPQQLGSPAPPSNSAAPIVSNSVPRIAYVIPTTGQQQVLLATSTAARSGQVRPTFMFRQVAPGQVPPSQRMNLVQQPRPRTVTVLSQNSPNVRPNLRVPQSGPLPRNAALIRTPLRHPAPLPGPPAVQPSQPTWKAMPPKPSLKISKAGDGIVLSWKMLNKDMSLYEDIASYQLYAYQETNSPPSTDMWRKVGDVKALALPMACTLTQFTDGNKYHFAVRAVDVKSRVGPFSPPEQISLP